MTIAANPQAYRSPHLVAPSAALVFIHIETRRIWVSPGTANPSGQWTTQQARNFQMHLQDERLPCEILQRDQDKKYVDSFDEVFRS